MVGVITIGIPKLVKFRNKPCTGTLRPSGLLKIKVPRPLTAHILAAKRITCKHSGIRVYCAL